MTKAKYAQLKKFFSQFPSQKFSKNSLIFKPGDKISHVYFMRSGFVRVYTKTSSGENTLNLFKPLFLLSVMHYFTSLKNNLYFQALTPVEVYVVPQSEFKKFLRQNEDLSDIIMDFFFNSLLLYLHNQGNIINGNAINKVSSVLLQLTHDYGDFKNDQLIVNFPATHRVVANIVGLTRETTSVQMSKLQKLNIISSRRTQFQVKNLEKLKKLANIGE